MVRKIAALSNLVCRILIHPTSLPSYVIGLASLLLAGRASQMKIFLDLSAENQPLWKTRANFYLLLCMISVADPGGGMCPPPLSL